MEGFFTDVLDNLTASDFLEAVQSKYHYRKEQLDELKSVAEQLLPLLKREACWNQGEYSIGVLEHLEHWQVTICLSGRTILHRWNVCDTHITRVYRLGLGLSISRINFLLSRTLTKV